MLLSEVYHHCTILYLRAFSQMKGTTHSLSVLTVSVSVTVTITLILLKQVLSSSTHSGGECSVSTILYLMALQVGWFLRRLCYRLILVIALNIYIYVYQWDITLISLHSLRTLTNPVPFAWLTRLIKAWTKSMNVLHLDVLCATQLVLKAVHSTF